MSIRCFSYALAGHCFDASARSQYPSFEWQQEAGGTNRGRRTVPSLRELCLQKLNPQSPPNISVRAADGSIVSAGDCIMDALGSAKDLSHIPPRWFERLNQEQMRELTSEALNSLLETQWQGFKYQQIAALNPEVFKNLSACAIGIIIRYFTNVLTKEQIVNIRPSAIREEFKNCWRNQGEINRFVDFLCRRGKSLTFEQVNAIVEWLFLALEAESAMTFGEEASVNIQLIISYILRCANEEQVRGLPQQVLQRLTPEIARAVGGYLQRWLTDNQRQSLNAEVRSIIARNEKYLGSVEDWEGNRDVGESIWRTRLSTIPFGAYALLSRRLHSSIPGAVLAEYLERHVEEFRQLPPAAQYYIIHAWGSSQLATMRAGAWLSLHLSYLAPSAIPGLNPEFLVSHRWNPSNSSTNQGDRGFLINLPPEHIAQLTPEQFSFINRDVLRTWNVDQIRALNPRVIASRDSYFHRQFSVLAERNDAWTFTREQTERIPIPLIEDYFTGPDRVYAHLVRPDLLLTTFEGILPQLSGGFYLHLPPRTLMAVPGYVFALRSSRFISGLNVPRLAVLTPVQVSSFRPNVFAALTASQLSYLRPEVFSRVTAEQLVALLGTGTIATVEEKIRSLRVAQIREIPVSTLRNLSLELLQRFYLMMSQEQQNGLTAEQKAFFRALMRGASVAEAGRRESPGGDGFGGSGGESGAGASGGRESSEGGARPKDRNFITKLRRLFPGGGSKKHAVPFLISPQDVREGGAIYLAPQTLKPEYSDIEEPAPTQYNLQEYHECVRSIPKDVLCTIPVSVIPGVSAIFFESLTPEQLMDMEPQQRNVITANCIAVEAQFQEILGITMTRKVSPAEYQRLIDQIDPRRFKEKATPQVIRELASNPNSFLLYYLKPEHLFNYGANDWNRDQIKEIPAKITQRWKAAHWNALSISQLAAVGVENLKTISQEVFPELNSKFFNQELQLGDEYARAFSTRVQSYNQSQLQAIPVDKIAQIGPLFFSNIRSEQIRMLTREQRQSISTETIRQLPPPFFYACSTAELVADFTKEQIASISATFFRQVGKSKEAVEFLRNLKGWQTDALTIDQLRTISLSAFDRESDYRFLNKVNLVQLQWLSPAQIASMPESWISKLDSRFTKWLLPRQIYALTERHIAALREKQVAGLGDKIASISPNVFIHKVPVENLFLHASDEQLRALNREQVGNIDVRTISSEVLMDVFRKERGEFIKLLTSSQIDEFSSEYLAHIPISIYAELLAEIYNKMSDSEIATYAKNISVDEFRIALKVWKEALITGEVALPDLQRRDLLKGIFRVRIQRSEKAPPSTRPTVIIVNSQIGAGGAMISRNEVSLVGRDTRALLI